MEQTIIRFDIIDRHTGSIVGTAKTRARARQSVDRRDNAYGAYRYFAKPIYGVVLQDGFGSFVVTTMA